MTPDDRELLVILRRQQVELRESLAKIDARLDQLEAHEAVAAIPPPPPIAARPGLRPAAMPPIPTGREPILPPIPGAVTPPPPPGPVLPPIPSPAGRPSIAPLPPMPLAPHASFEFRFGRWLTRIGAVFGVITLALILSLTHAWLFKALGPAGILGFSGAVCVCIVIAGSRLARRTRSGGLRLFGLSVEAMGLAGLYVTFYAAHYFPGVAIITSPLAAGLLLLSWSIYVLVLAEREKSQAFALFAILLAYFSTAINPAGRFTMAADLLLAGTAVLFFWRRGWTSFTWIAVLGTNYALLRRLVVDENGDFTLATTHSLPFAPYAVYLIAAWSIFTIGLVFVRNSSLRREKRIALLSLNNGAFAFLMTLTTYVAGYGFRAMGWTLFWIGLALLATAGVARILTTAEEISGAYLAQGLALFTAGLMGIWSGVPRGVLLLVETFFLGFAASISRSLIYKLAAALTALLATAFLLWEIGVDSHDPWRLGIFGAVVMLFVAWWARRAFRYELHILPAPSYYVALALSLLAMAMVTKLSDNALPPALALVALALTFSIYRLPLPELPVMAQGLLLGAQALVLFPAETGEEMPAVCTLAVAAITLGLLIWWPRQRAIPCGPWIVLATFVYALALVGLTWHAVRPELSDQSWMVASALLAFAFLTVGALARIWPLAAMGQLFLISSLEYFSFPNGKIDPYIWSWPAAAVPITAVFVTGRAIHSWLRVFPETPEAKRRPWHRIGTLCQWLALFMVIRLIFELVPQACLPTTLLLFGTGLVAWNAVRNNAAGIRAGFIPSLLGVAIVLGDAAANPAGLVTVLNGLAIFALLLQPAFLRFGRRVIGEVESWAVVVVAVGTGWIFVNTWVDARLHPNDLTMGWAVYALVLFLLGLFVRERRLRWCGLFVLAAAILRVLLFDIWGFSNSYKVLTFVVLTFITLGLGFLYARLADRLKARH
jgi:predicted membrane protein DUF2339